MEKGSGNRTHHSLSFGYTAGFADQEGHQPLAPHSGIAFVFFPLPVLQKFKSGVFTRLLFLHDRLKEESIKYSQAISQIDNIYGQMAGYRQDSTAVPDMTDSFNQRRFILKKAFTTENTKKTS
jgi:hypothetical protein